MAIDKELSLISDQYKMFMASAASENPALNAFTAQIEVEGVLAYIGRFLMVLILVTKTSNNAGN